MLITGIVLTFVMKVTVYSTPQSHPLLYDFLITILITTVVWEGNLRIDNWMNLHYPWVSKTKTRFLIQFLVSMFYSAIIIYAFMLFYNYWVCCLSWQNKSLMKSSFGIGLVVSFIILTFEVSGQFFQGWKNSLLEVEKYKTENAQAQLQNLKDQVNPHFLFNNLSVLSSLVYQNQDKAVDFINQLSKVYRYILDSKNNELVTLEDELTFLKSYMYLLKIRFDESLHFELNIDETLNRHYLPPMSLQMLVENAIKHNEVSAEFPLHVTITSSLNNMIVSNNLQKRKLSEESTKTGLKNIEARYKYFTDQPISIEESDHSFTVSIPLIQQV